MAKVTITIEDDGDGVKVRSDFDPPLDNTGDEDSAVERMTPAQRMGAYATMQLMDGGEIDTSDEEE